MEITTVMKAARERPTRHNQAASVCSGVRTGSVTVLLRIPREGTHSTWFFSDDGDKVRSTCHNMTWVSSFLPVHQHNKAIQCILQRKKLFLSQRLIYSTAGVCVSEGETLADFLWTSSVSQHEVVYSIPLAKCSACFIFIFISWNRQTRIYSARWWMVWMKVETIVCSYTNTLQNSAVHCWCQFIHFVVHFAITGAYAWKEVSEYR